MYLTSFESHPLYQLSDGLTTWFSASSFKLLSLVNCHCTHHILSSIDKVIPQCGVLLDIKKGFDLVDHSLLISEILSLNPPLYITHWLKFYLCMQSVKVEDTISSFLIESGVLQSSILGPLLFVINNLASILFPNNSKLILFADNIFLLHLIQSPQDCAHIQTSLNLITEWLTINNLCVNPAKSKFIYFSFGSQSSFDPFHPFKVTATMKGAWFQIAFSFSCQHAGTTYSFKSYCSL